MKSFVDYLDEMQAEAAEGGEDPIKMMLEVMMRAVMEAGVEKHLGAGRHERTENRKGHRNGHKPRKLKTRVGELDLVVPQVRGIEPYSPHFFAKWERTERALLVACAEMYFMGVSTRKVKNVLEKMGGFDLSASTVSCVAQELDEKLAEFRARRLDECDWLFLMVDACYVKVRRNKRMVKQAVLVVAGINSEGRREILTWRMANVESEDTWTEVFRELRQRGVHGVQWVISDGHEGIQNAVRTQWEGVAWQRCWTHFMRNALAKVNHRHKDALANELKAARKLEDTNLCLAEAERIAERWEKQYPRLAAQIRDQFEETLATHGLPSTCRRRVYTTNMMERVMREIKRRTNVVGIFPNDASADRLIGAQLMECHEKWVCERARYLNLEQYEDWVDAAKDAD
jgi:putative transposase